MKYSYDSLIKRPRVLHALTGLKPEQMAHLLPVFEQKWEDWISLHTFEGLPRQRAYRPRKNSSFPRSADMLIFILHHHRHNLTQELMGFEYELDQSKVSRWITNLAPLLEGALDQLGLVPASTSRELDDLLVETTTLIVDATERTVQRPKYDQQDYYSGKKRDTR